MAQVNRRRVTKILHERPEREESTLSFPLIVEWYVVRRGALFCSLSLLFVSKVKLRARVISLRVLCSYFRFEYVYCFLSLSFYFLREDHHDFRRPNGSFNTFLLFFLLKLYWIYASFSILLQSFHFRECINTCSHCFITKKELIYVHSVSKEICPRLCCADQYSHLGKQYMI